MLRPNPTRKERRLIRDLGRFRRRAGKIRDMDVLTAAVTSVYDPEETDCAVQLLEYLGTERYKHARKLHARMNKNGSYIAHRVKRLSARLVASIPDASASSSKSSQTSSAMPPRSAFPWSLTLLEH